MNNLSVKAILSATLLAGTFDIVFAIVIYALIMEQTSPVRLLQYIASGVFGKSAFEGGMPMALAGLAFHFLNAFLFSSFYFILVSYIGFLRKQRLISGIIYGIAIWLVMNLIVLPITFGSPVPQNPLLIALGMSILIVAVGIPIAYIVPTGISPLSKE